MPPRLAPPAYAFWAVFAFCSLFALVYVAWIAWEAVPRLKAGPVRFRLRLASLAKPKKPQQGLTAAAFGFYLVPILLWLIVMAKSPDDSLYLAFFSILLLWVVASILFGTTYRWSNPRRDTKPWRVLAAGLLALVIGTVALGFGLRALQTSENPAGHPAGPFILVALFGFVRGATALQEYMSGTRVRERGIEVFGTFLPWWRIVVCGWHPREGGFDGVLYLAIPSLRLFRVPVTPDAEVCVPVPAAERPALEVFLAGHTATAGCRG